MDKLIQAQRDYINFLSTYLNNLSGYLYAHKMLPGEDIVKEGQKHRDHIETLELLMQEDGQDQQDTGPPY